MMPERSAGQLRSQAARFVLLALFSAFLGGGLLRADDRPACWLAWVLSGVHCYLAVCALEAARWAEQAP